MSLFMEIGSSVYIAYVLSSELYVWKLHKCCWIKRYVYHINPLRSKFFTGHINIYLHFVSFLHIDTTQVVEILPQIRQEPTFST